MRFVDDDDDDCEEDDGSFGNEALRFSHCDRRRDILPLFISLDTIIAIPRGLALLLLELQSSLEE